LLLGFFGIAALVDYVGGAPDNVGVRQHTGQTVILELRMHSWTLGRASWREDSLRLGTWWTLDEKDYKPGNMASGEGVGGNSEHESSRESGLWSGCGKRRCLVFETDHFNPFFEIFWYIKSQHNSSITHDTWVPCLKERSHHEVHGSGH
jgi:hypothetical protein